MNNKEKLQSEILRVSLVLESAERSGESFRAAVIRYKLKEADRVLWWESSRGIEKSLKELEGII